MAAKKSPVPTPLHLLQQLSASLLEHLHKACEQALGDAEQALAKLEKQRGKAQEKLQQAQAKLEKSAESGKAKAQAKARARVDEVEQLIATLQVRKAQTLDYLAGLRDNVARSLHLAGGIDSVRASAAEALDAPVKAAVSKPAGKPRTATKPRAAAKPAAAKPAAKATASRPAAKPIARKPAAAKATPVAKAPASTAPTKPRRAPRSKPAASDTPA